MEYLSNENTTLAVRIEDTNGFVYKNKKVVELFGTVLNYAMNQKMENGSWRVRHQLLLNDVLNFQILIKKIIPN